MRDWRSMRSPSPSLLRESTCLMMIQMPKRMCRKLHKLELLVMMQRQTLSRSCASTSDPAATMTVSPHSALHLTAATAAPVVAASAVITTWEAKMSRTVMMTIIISLLASAVERWKQLLVVERKAMRQTRMKRHSIKHKCC